MSGIRPPSGPRGARWPSRWGPTVAILAVVLAVVGGGYVAAGALSTPAGPPIDLAGAVRVRPLSGWRETGRLPLTTRLTRGNGNLDVLVSVGGGPALPGVLATDYVRDRLEPDASRLSVSKDLDGVTLDSGIRAVRFAYVGVFGRGTVPVEGEVTALVSPSGVRVIFDGWAPSGLHEFVDDDVNAMIEAAVVA